MLMTTEQLKPYDKLVDIYKTYILVSEEGKLYMPNDAPQEAKDAWKKKKELDKQYEGWLY
ncbi:MAG: hypothetical protein E7K64_01320 [Clostridia bacterium]|nr:hypothetical protein [Peptococcus niger]MDU7245618.1 hypothetical protein [Clostridiales bacterium]MDU7504674.1 hypothetical protein [Clostridia bacterium]